jgi:hypothetical protein
MDFIVGWFFTAKMVDIFCTVCVFPCLKCLVNLTQRRKEDGDGDILFYGFLFGLPFASWRLER